MENNNEFLKAEYLHLQTTIEGFDNKALSIKTWSITFSFAACGVAFANDAIWIFPIASIASLAFWFLEASWKTFQYAHYERIRELEDYFSNKTRELIPFQITKSWYLSYKKDGVGRLFKIMFWHHVYLPHLLISIIAFALFCLIHFNYVKI